MVKSVLFDLDGTLVDTGSGIIESVRYTIENMNLNSLDQNELEAFVGPPIKMKFQQTFGLSEEKALEAVNIFRRHYAIDNIYIANPYEGINNLLKELKSDGYKLGVATYKREDLAINLLEKLNMSCYFDVIHGADLDGMMTKADIINRCLDDLNCLSSKAVMIGDSDNDAIAAEMAGVSFVGVTFGYGFKQNEDVFLFKNIGFARDCKSLYKLITKYFY